MKQESHCPIEELVAANPVASRVWQKLTALQESGERAKAFRETVPVTALFRLDPALLPKDLQGIRAEIWLKDDRQMPGKSYKLRGAWYRLYDEVEARGDVSGLYAVTASTGNHLNQVGRAAKALGFAGTRGYVPEGASMAKLRDAAAQGVHITTRPNLEIALHDARALDDGVSAVYVPPFDHESIMAGQGSVGLEIAKANVVSDPTITKVYFPGGGGGVASGNAVAIAQKLPGAQVFVSQAVGAHGIVAALRGEALNPAELRQKCDGAAVAVPGALPMSILGDTRFAKSATVSDAHIGEAMALLSHTGEVPEPAGALALALLLAHLRASRYAEGVFVAHLSGANKTPEKVREYMQDALAARLIPLAEARRVIQQAYQENSDAGVDELLPTAAHHMGALGMRSA